MSLIIGVDGGGTKSTYKVFDMDNSQIYEFVGTSINFYSIGNERATNGFSKSINEIKEKFGKNILSIFIGNAALGLGEDISKEHPFAKCVSEFTSKSRIVSDLYIGLKGVNSNPAIFLISGTGSMGIAENIDGNLFSIGGWGYLLGDQGSGYYIGINGLREAIKSYDNITEQSVLTQKAIEYFDVKDLEEIIDIIYASNLENKVIANFAVEVHKAASNGDKTSKIILEKSIKYLAKCVLNLHKKLNCKDVTLGVFGGNFQKSEYFLNEFKKLVCAEADNIRIDLPEFTPVEAALILAGKEVDLDISDKVKQASRL
jgi:glucosamine kinase